jgi:hypothetical protein
LHWSGLPKLAQHAQPEVRNMQIDVRWCPRIANDSSAFDISFCGEIGAVETNVLAHIDRLYLNQTIIKHPDRAETTKFWNFSLLDISRALQSALEVAVSQDAFHLWIDISHHRIDVRLADSVESKVGCCLDAENFLGTVQAHPLYRAPYEETDAGATR